MKSRLRSWLSSIANQLRIGLVGFVGVAVLATAGFLIWISLQAQTAAQEELQSVRSRAAAAEIDNFFDDLLRKLGYLARLRGIIQLPRDVQETLVDGLLRTNQAFEGVVLLDREGRVLASRWQSRAEDLGDVTQRPAFVLPLRRGQDYIGYAETSPELGVPTLTVALPVRDREDRVAGVLLARVNLRFLWSFLSRVRVGETGYAYVVDQRLFVIARKGAPTGALDPADLSNAPFMQRLDDRAPAVYEGLNGARVVGASSPIQSVRWHVVVERPIDEAFAPVRRLVEVMGAALATSAVLAIGLGYAYARRLVQPLKKLTKAAAALSGGDLSTRVAMQQPNELGTLGAAFDQMAERLETNVGRLELALDEARAARAEAEQALLLRERFLLLAAHELRTPLTPLNLQIQTARRMAAAHDELPPAFVRALTSAEQSVARLRKLAEELLDLVHMLAGELELHPEDADLCAIVSDVAARCADRLRAAGSTLTVRCDGPVTGRWDRRRIDQLLSALVDNAIKFGEHAPIELRVAVSADAARVEVQDHGIGISGEFLPHVFDLYSRAVSEQHFGGFGVGLYVAQRIAEASGGSIRVESERGVGSTFTVELPRYPASS